MTWHTLVYNFIRKSQEIFPNLHVNTTYQDCTTLDSQGFFLFHNEQTNSYFQHRECKIESVKVTKHVLKLWFLNWVSCRNGQRTVYVGQPVQRGSSRHFSVETKEELGHVYNHMACVCVCVCGYHGGSGRPTPAWRHSGMGWRRMAAEGIHVSGRQRNS